MIVRVGDDPKPWVARVEDFGGSWECVRPEPAGTFRACRAHPRRLSVVAAPSHEPGDRVRVGRRSGTVEGLSEGSVRVRLDEERRPLKGGGFLSDAGLVSVPLWQINVENKIK